MPDWQRMNQHNMDPHKDDEYWMQQALDQARIAFAAAEVPVGAVMVYEGRCIAVGHNMSVSSVDPTAHAEINVLRKAAQELGNYRLNGCTLYVTLEPCAMCAMAMLHARIDRVVYGAVDSKTGAAGSVVNLFDQSALNHQTQVTKGILAQDCAALLKVFFEQRRIKTKVPLRDDALRTAESCFTQSVLGEGIYTHLLPSLEGLQLYYHRLPVKEEIDFADVNCVVLCLHDAYASSEQYMDLARLIIGKNVVLIPDLIGFGRSDKVKKTYQHSFEFHATYLAELVGMYLHGQAFIIFAPMAFKRLVALLQDKIKSKAGSIKVCLIQRLPDVSQMIQNAAFPDKGYRCGPRVLQQWTHEGVESDYEQLERFTADALVKAVQVYEKQGKD